MNSEENKAGMNPVDLLNEAAYSMTQERLSASKVAVLTGVAREPSVTSGPLVRMTNLSVPNVGRILNFLGEAGDLTIMYEQPPTPEYPTVRRHFYITPSGVGKIRKVINHMGWGDMSRFRIVNGAKGTGNDEGMDPVDLLNRLACCMTQEQLSASQVGVLTGVARCPGMVSGSLVKGTGLSRPNVGRILNYLVDVGDLTFVYEQPPTPEYPTVRRRFYITPSGMKTIRKVINHMGWGDMGGFRILEDVNGNKLYRL